MQLDTTRTTRLSGSPLWIARIAWVAFVALTLGLYAIAFFEFMGESRPPFTEVFDPTNFTAEYVEVLRDLGLAEMPASWPTYVPFAVLGLVYFAVAAVIFRRRSSDWMALLVSFSLVFIGAFFMGLIEDVITRNHSELVPLKGLVGISGFVAMLLVLFVLKAGRFELANQSTLHGAPFDPMGITESQVLILELTC